MSRWITGMLGTILSLMVLTAFAGEKEVSSIGRFEIARYEVQGNSLLPMQDITALLAPYVGQNQDFSSVQRAVETLETAYRQHGYDIVRVILPEQELNHGVVILKVIEAKIGKISVKGNKFFDDANIKNSLPTLKEGQTPVMALISANLKLANEDPAKKTTVQLQSGVESGYVNAELKVVDEKPWSAALSVDNTGDEATGRNRLTAMVQNANIGGWDHVLSMQYTTSLANPNDVNVFGLGYHIPIYSRNDSLDFYASYSNVNSGTVTAGVFDLAVSGSGTVAGTRYNHNLLKTGDYDSTLTTGIDYKVFNNNESLSGLNLGNHIVVHPVSITYTGNWSVTGTSANFFLTEVHNIMGGNDSSSADFANARVGATPVYNLIRYGFNYQHAFPHDWELRFSLNGQVTSDALVAGEQFGAGGANSVRGFSEREIVNDKGRTTNMELDTFNLCSGGSQCKLIGFYDTGYVGRNYPLPGEIEHESIGSVGVGFRYTRAPAFLMQTDLGHVTDASTSSVKGSNRIHFKVVYAF